MNDYIITKTQVSELIAMDPATFQNAARVLPKILKRIATYGSHIIPSSKYNQSNPPNWYKCAIGLAYYITKNPDTAEEMGKGSRLWAQIKEMRLEIKEKSKSDIDRERSAAYMREYRRQRRAIATGSDPQALLSRVKVTNKERGKFLVMMAEYYPELVPRSYDPKGPGPGLSGIRSFVHPKKTEE